MAQPIEAFVAEPLHHIGADLKQFGCKSEGVHWLYWRMSRVYLLLIDKQLWVRVRP